MHGEVMRWLSGRLNRNRKPLFVLPGVSFHTTLCIVGQHFQVGVAKASKIMPYLIGIMRVAVEWVIACVQPPALRSELRL